jgi:putative transposase
MLYIRFPLPPRTVKDLRHGRSIEIRHETVRYWWNRFAAKIRVRRVEPMRAQRHWRRHLDEVCVMACPGRVVRFQS